MSMLLLFRPRGGGVVPPVVIIDRRSGKPQSEKKKRRNEYLVSQVDRKAEARLVPAKHDFTSFVLYEERVKKVKKRKKQCSEILLLMDLMFDDEGCG